MADEATDWSSIRIVDFVSKVSPQFMPPAHLMSWCQLIERARTERIRAMVSVPVRHHKTWTTLHGVAWLMMHRPAIRIIGMCADHDRAQELGNMTRRICEAVAELTHIDIGPVRGENKALDWKNSSNGGVVWMSADQSALGKDIDVLIVDDPIAEKKASDAATREAVDHAINHYTMRATGSVLIVMSRWHPDDPIGRRLSRKTPKWEYVHNRAIEDEGLPSERAFAPDVMDLEEIRRRREEAREADPGEFLWHAQWQNEPRSAVDSKVCQPALYQTAPTYPGFRYAIGVDLAYKAGEKSDWFACVVVKFYGRVGYIIEVVRERPDFQMMEHVMRSRWERYERCPMFSYVAGPEIGAIKYFTERGIPIQALPARYSKAYRAQNTITRWNAGELQVPTDTPWTRGFVARAMMFTGNEKERDDDEWDALVSVCDPMLGGVAAGMPYGIGHRRIPRSPDAGNPDIDPRSSEKIAGLR